MASKQGWQTSNRSEVKTAITVKIKENQVWLPIGLMSNKSTDPSTRCPQALIPGHDGNRDESQLPLVRVDCFIEVNVVVATVRIRTVYKNTSSSAVSGIYKASNAFGHATVTSCDISYPGRRFVTAVVDPDVVNPSENGLSNTGGEQHFQDLLFFSLPFQDLGVDSEMLVELCYIQNLSFTPSGFYELTVPLQVSPEQMPPSGEIESYISCKLDVGTVSCMWECPTHALSVVAQNGSYCALEAHNADIFNHLLLRLNALSDNISCSCAVQPNNISLNQPGGNFLAFVSPPSQSCLPPTKIGRNMVHEICVCVLCNGYSLIVFSKW